VLACKKIEQPEMAQLNKECECAKEVSADFVMEERDGLTVATYKYTNTDTIFFNKNVRFRALETDANYTWYIGNEVLNIQQFERYFGEVLIGQNIPISLVVKKTPNTICFPDDDGYDSITKILHVSQYIISTPDDYDFGSIESTFRVKSDHLADSFDIKVVFTRNLNIDPLTQLINIENYDGLGSNCYNNQALRQRNYRQVFFEQDGMCEQMRGNIHHGLDGLVEFNLNFNIGIPGSYFERVYRGRKL